MDLDAAMNDVRSVLRGEASGSTRLMILIVLALATWAGVSWARARTEAAVVSLAAQEGRWRTLSMLAAEHEALGPKAAQAEDVDVSVAFVQVSERMELGGRVRRTAPDGSGLYVEVEKLYAEELVELCRQLVSRGVRALSAEVRALPSGGERLLSLSAVIAPASRGGAR
ncbi:MAG: hypothetical protein IJR14_02470 [Synergistaceae bacterium]|nr:hypothetical protein [Synergistaceae bacterium]